MFKRSAVNVTVILLIGLMPLSLAACKGEKKPENQPEDTSYIYEYYDEEDEGTDNSGTGEANQAGSGNASTRASSGSSKASGKAKDFVWWTTSPGEGKPTELLSRAIEEFEKKTGIGIDLKIQQKSSGAITEFDAKFVPAMGAGNGPDITGFKYINTEYAMDITKSFNESFWNQFFPSVREALKLDGKYYSVPGGMSVNGLLKYSKNCFRNAGLDPNSPPTTLAQFDDYAQKLFIAKGESYSQLGYDPWTWYQLAYPTTIFKPFGGRLTNDEGYPTINSAENIAAMEWMMKYANKYGYKKVESAYTALTNEQNDLGHALAMNMTFSGGINAAASNLNSNEWGITMFPGVDSTKNGLALGLSTGYSIVKGCKNYENAVEFIRFMATDYQTNYYVKNYKDQPGYSANQSAWKKHLGSMDPFTTMLYNDVLAKSRSSDFKLSEIRLTKYSAPSNLDELVSTSVRKILDGKAEIRAELNALQTKVVAQTKTN